MFLDSRSIAVGTTINADVCIIGGGAAAIAVALEFINSKHEVVVIPGGGHNQTATGIDLYRGKATPPGSHEPLEENRLRMWGGTTTVWGGRCVPFDSIDFEKRPWVPHSGWPIATDILEKFIDRANELSEAGTADFDARTVFPDTQHEILKGFDDDNMVSWPLERWSVPTDYSKRYGPVLESAKNIRVFLHSHAIHLQLDPGGTTLNHVKAASSPDRFFQIHAKSNVLACGALENARLLLASRDVQPSGIGNNNDLVGRFYQSHRFLVCGYAVLKAPETDFIYDFERDSEGVYCRRRFWLTPKAQETHKTGNVVGFFFRNVSGSSEHRNAMVSTVLLVKMILGGAKKGPKRLFNILKDQRQELWEHLCIIAKDGPGIFGQIASVAYTRYIQKRKLPMVLPPKKVNRFPLFIQTEHSPNPESRVLLDPDSVDEFGMPRLEAQIKFEDIDFRTIQTFVSLFKDRLEQSGLGTFHLSEDDNDLLAHPQLRRFNSNSHNIGTTRMGQTADSGVIDPDCKVFGVDNLFIAGSSVFPTSSHANPTLMIIALAIRLADHLKAKV